MVQDVVADALTMFAIMASLMNLALSASQRYLNEGFAVSQHDYGNLGRLMVTVGAIGLVPLLAMPLLWREERAGPITAAASKPQPAS
jgi:hypothetical protein